MSSKKRTPLRITQLVETDNNQRVAGNRKEMYGESEKLPSNTKQC